MKKINSHLFQAPEPGVQSSNVNNLQYSELQVHVFRCLYTYGPQIYWLRQPRNAFASENHLTVDIWAAADLAGRPQLRHSAANRQIGCFQNKLTFANDAAASFWDAAK